MIQAVKRFEPEKGFRLATYATEYILRSWSLVRSLTMAPVPLDGRKTHQYLSDCKTIMARPKSPPKVRLGMLYA